jgi:hypothetical protein
MSRTSVMPKLDSKRFSIYRGANLIEARAAAILTPHLPRHALAVGLGFLVSPIKAGKDGCPMGKLPGQVLSCRAAERCASRSLTDVLSAGRVKPGSFGPSIWLGHILATDSEP